MNLRELKEVLDMLPEECLDYQVDVCYSNGEYDDTGKWIDHPWYDWIEQIQIFDDKRKIVFHGDYTCFCSREGIWGVVDDNGKNYFDNCQ